jgi:hypothetical protein
MPGGQALETAPGLSGSPPEEMRLQAGVELEQPRAMNVPERAFV